ncbi:AT-rich interactive domain-containing protein 5A isoform X2 [Sphaeramia orbicularis]|uniref:AT-rich interactive domain-containing protein 5A isoform X2 n=1 Tax=Sphaeramia orbicularis TaxID=375764 RepID=UPI0011815265|nr:AT-rich interactive domain-containing protein 5A-like isoform X2 [Sphaeramia orbicularis]
MKVPDGDTFLFCGDKQKRTLNELVSPNSVKSETRRHPLEMAEGDQNETSQQTSVSDEEEEMVNQTSPSVIEIHDSTNECEEEVRPSMVQVEEKSFVSRLHSFMKNRGTPIERIPHLGFKQINLWRIYKAVEKLGGYDSVTARRLWKKVYDELGGSPGSTSAATCTRRHYERLVLPFERHIKGEEDKPLPPSKPRKPYKRNVDSKVNKAEGKRKRTQSDREMDSEVLTQRRPDAVCQSETGMHTLSSLWTATSDKHHSDCSQPNRTSTDLCTTVYACPHLLQVPTTNPWTAHIPSATGEVISPLEKKKRLAQASLNLPLSPQGEDKERPSVIHCSQSPVPASSTRNCNSSDGSPHPLSSSSSRSPSPLSVSSEDSPTSNQDKPPSSLDLSQNCSSSVKNPSSWSEDKSLSQISKEPTGQNKDISLVNSRSLTAEVMKSQIKNTAWTPIHKGAVTHFRPPIHSSSSYTEKPYWAPTSTSSFTTVIPKSVQLLRPAPIRPGYKEHQSRLTQQDETLTCTKKLNNVSPRLYQTEKWDKSRTMLSRVPPSQQSLSPSNTTLPTSCVLSGYDKSSRDTRHQPPFHPGFHPGRMRLPQAQLMYRHFPVSPAHSALIGSVGYPYPYPIPVLSAQTGYALPTMMPIYPHKL